MIGERIFKTILPTSATWCRHQQQVQARKSKPLESSGGFRLRVYFLKPYRSLIMTCQNQCETARLMAENAKLQQEIAYLENEIRQLLDDKEQMRAEIAELSGVAA